MAANSSSARSRASGEAYGNSGEWSFSLLKCFAPRETCCMSVFCPCVLYGKIYDRVRHGDAHSSGVNGQCLIFALLMPSGFNAIPGMFTRGLIREKYGIAGNAAGDLCAAWCCLCNSLVQEHNELIVRSTGIDPTTDKPYVSPAQMVAMR